MYKVDILPKAEKHLEAHKKSGNKVVMERIDRIFKELKLHPETGIGSPKKMKHKYSGFWSREIDKKNRMLYKIDENIVTISVVSAMGHYDDK
jgi:toxin YoeB